MTRDRTLEIVVIGAGIAGMQASLLLSKAGRKVHLIEHTSVIGGSATKFEEVFTNMECATCMLAPMEQELLQDSNINLMTLANIEEVIQTPQGFKVKVRVKARFVDTVACIGCGVCYDPCPASAPNEYEMGLSSRRAIFVPYAGALPNVPMIDPDLCIRFRGHQCEKCKKACAFEAVDFEQEDRILELEVGSIIVATGTSIINLRELPKYGYGKIDGVYSSLEFERLYSSNGPTLGKLVLRDGRVPKSVAIVHCVGRSESGYCSSVCCMYSFKFNHYLRSKIPEIEIIEFVTDLCVPGKAGQHFMKEAASGKTRIIRVRDLEIREGTSQPIISYSVEDGGRDEAAVDMVILAPSLIPDLGTQELAEMLGISTDNRGFLQVNKDNRIEWARRGIFVIGCAEGPKDIEASVAQANAATAKILREGLLDEL